ncbi:alpha-amylase family glycosyl hydrolase [Rhodanobacter sp. L36]|uniref:alpha-amylase family glycosyl hydrolase n=1 Tax=Rhodanobacter sp. L36 TaxID=1747221 RepID=UPI00131B50F3|nr:alpha-amylase family glycosyl hydrolase [Rhodanobacter sp. L36]
MRFRLVMSLLFLPLAMGLLATTSVASAPTKTRHAHAARSTSPSNVWYEIFVRSWYDTNGDGIGDINGVTAKLDYLQSLGISGIWLMPINPSPSYHGYDVTDYDGINPQYGSMADFERLLAEAHKRGIKVIMDLVINHTSDRHPWFLAAQRPDDLHHHWYTWATPGTNLAAMGATDSRAWHATPDGRHYLGIFAGSMPDLDYDEPEVRQAMIDVGRLWLSKGVDGFRLDAAQHIYDDFESQKNDRRILDKNLAWWSAFRRGIDTVNPHAYLVGEVARESPEEIAGYFHPFDAAFDFPLAQRLIDSARTERNDGLDDLLERSDALYRKASRRDGVDAPFLSNHDQDRVMSQLGGNASHMRMAAAMLLTLPGQPFVYYGEELGTLGRKPDPDLREPMRWYRDPHGSGETSWKTLNTADGPNISVQAEQRDHHSLLHFYRTLIDWRRQVSALRDGSVRAFRTGHRQVVGWALTDAHEHVLVLHNLSAQTQSIELHGWSFTAMQLHTDAGTAIANGRLIMPPYSSAVLR